MQNQWDEIDYNKAHYLIENGYIMNLDIFELAKILYNKRMAEMSPPTHKDNVGLLGKVFD